MGENYRKHVVIVGNGLVGSLMANFMARRGYKVDVYEKRDDLRNSGLIQGRSINLSLSNRARRALRAVGLENEVLQAAVPMKGRLLHGLSGETKSILYDGVTNQCLFSISRNYLNRLLVTDLEKHSGVQMHFNHKLVGVDFDEGEVTFLNTLTNGNLTQKPDLIIAADGAYSTLRRHLQNTSRLNFSQTYIEHGYLELTIDKARGVQMIPNHLHIWPRGDFMMIALPNADKSWTVTLFMPFKKFASITTPEKLISFFKSTFPDFLDFSSEELLSRDFFRKKPMPLVSVKCDPYHHGGKFLIIGDAAHAMVPFYGQGLNAGFEDCNIFDRILNATNDDFAMSIEKFTRHRKDDAHAICELAMYNYVEMRDLVTKNSYKLRKKFDEIMFRVFPDKWIPLYNSVTFSSMGYQECMEHRKWQDRVLKLSFLLATTSATLSSLFYVYF